MDVIAIILIIGIIGAGVLRAFSVVDGRITGGGLVLAGLLFLWLLRGA
jgi:hypothetical protein